LVSASGARRGRMHDAGPPVDRLASDFGGLFSLSRQPCGPRLVRHGAGVADRGVGVAAKIGADDISWRLADALSPCFLTRTVWEEAQSAYETALAAATRVEDPIAEAAILTGIGNLWVFIAADDGVALPYYHRALKLFREAGARAQMAHLLALIASSLSELGDHDGALRHFDQGLDLAREVGEPAREAVVLCNLAITLLRVGRPEESIEASTRALENRRAVQDERGSAHVLDNLGDAHMALGDHARAADCYREALTIVRAMRDRRCRSDLPRQPRPSRASCRPWRAGQPGGRTGVERAGGSAGNGRLAPSRQAPGRVPRRRCARRGQGSGRPWAPTPDGAGTLMTNVGPCPNGGVASPEHWA
jgi:Uncharacterized protein conserved in bacteria